MAENHKHTNRLINETSPYLLQHAHNPVDWYPWGEEALNKAKEENKLLLISIGYSACHWCHVMERESFEDDSVATLMNEKYVCIKIDREERPDIDQVYMTAVQMMTGSGGWPLNAIALPDGRPIYGGTYFPKAKWTEVLHKLSELYTTEPTKTVEYAEQLTEGIKQSELIEMNDSSVAFEPAHLDAMVKQWSKSFDSFKGGPNRAPKFPLPNNYQFLLHYAHLTGDEVVKAHALFTLDRMAYGGIYDQIGGGFSRYSVDLLWKVPHFEKMLYDNGQLVSLYAMAYQATGNKLYRDVVYETLAFVERELTAPEGAFYSALDADSEGEEGKFYIWNKEELSALLGEDAALAYAYYNVNSLGLWEHDNYILLRDRPDNEVAAKLEISVEDLQAGVQRIKEKLMAARDKRIRPGLDDKTLTSWNALMLKGYVDAAMAFDEPKFLDAALRNANFILEKQLQADGSLLHSYKEGRSTINGYLEDYCFTIEAFIALFEATFDQKWLDQAKALADYTIAHFYDETSGMFFFTSDIDPPLIARKTELNDNVIPSSNSSMAKGLFLLGQYFDHAPYLDKANQMLKNVYDGMPKYGSGYSNWGILLLNQTYPFYEIAVVGKDVVKKNQEFAKQYIPNKLMVGSTTESTLPLLEYKYVEDQTTIYVCQNKSCQLPVTEVLEALKQIK